MEVFLVYITSFSLSSMLIHPTQEAQIALLITEEVKIIAKYLNFLNVILEEKALVLLKINKLN